MIDHDDEALAKLRASDPATGSHPDLHSLRALISTKAPASQGTDRVTAVHDDAFRGPRVHAPWIAAAAVAAFAMGGGGYALGAHTAEPQPVAGQPGAGNGDTEDGAEGDSAAMGGMAADGASITEAAGEARSEASMGGAGPNYDMGPVRLLPGPGLPTERGTAPVRALTSDVDAEEFLTTWAERLGVEGVRPDPEEGSEGWYGETVMIEPDTLRILSVSSEGGGGLRFNYEDQLNSPYCEDMYSGALPEDLEMMREEWVKAMGPDIPPPDPSMCTTPEGSPPSEEQAVAAAEDFLASTGLDLSGYTFQGVDYQEPGSSSITVEGWPEGMRGSELAMNLTVGPTGVVSAWGAAGEMTSLGDYPVISAVEAVERYAQREFGMEYGVTLPEDMMPYEGDMSSMPVPDYTVPPPVPVEPGMQIPLLMKDKVVTSAELTTGTMWTQSAGNMEVPAWKLMTDDGMHYAVLAIADESIDWIAWE
ncbi:hypothetical protein [Ornithinimicrobium cerasi]|uniref:Uncharacterized protein n=1 Tax=Ornithinimicrobium cerasi TaxID=2248773 RepID=A0A285VRK5_9MICO|nr:hypothetical protein [Ornithinimicrobium cerasi]SOC55856.1 hypothetical protein SAMN05421879_10680 [Ornithinimicrobium cerasi]